MGTDETKEFWENQEKEIGEKIDLYTLAEYKEGNLDIAAPKVGLLYLTSEALYFHTFPKSNWMSNLLVNLKKSKENKENIICRIPFTDIRKIEVKKLSWYMKILSTQLPQLSISYASGPDETKNILIALHSKSDQVIEYTSGKY